jgi:lipopolysaccharide biosynthesis glycosyltransferase
MTEFLDIFVGTDRSQLLAVAVLEFSIKRHTNHPVRVCPLIDLDLPEPKDVRQSSRTNFSFARFSIPELKSYSGMALYLDADMLVFRDIAALWQLPFNGAKIIVQGAIASQVLSSAKVGAPATRKKQCSVMMMDCGVLDWHAPTIIRGLDGRYTYEQLMSEMCILREEEVSYTLPFEWNSLEHYNENTCLIHYTDMHTQPWVSTENGFGYLWLREVRRMLDEQALSWSALKTEIDLGYFRPSLIEELNEPAALESFSPERSQLLAAIDQRSGFVKHAEVYARKKAREAALAAYEEVVVVQNVALQPKPVSQTRGKRVEPARATAPRATDFGLAVPA